MQLNKQRNNTIVSTITNVVDDVVNRVKKYTNHLEEGSINIHINNKKIQKEIIDKQIQASNSSNNTGLIVFEKNIIQ